MFVGSKGAQNGGGQATSQPVSSVEEKPSAEGGVAIADSAQSPARERSMIFDLLLQYGYMLTWITLSAAVILINKYVLSFSGFPYPIALTCLHMLFCASLAMVAVRTGWVEVTPISFELYTRGVIPIGLLFAGTLWSGNAAYLFLSVSFIQMLKACMPVVVFVVGVIFGTEAFTWTTGVNMVVIGTGIAIASYGEILFVPFGVFLQVASICTESVRLTMIQILLQRQGIKLSPISTLYHVAPCCFVFLALPFTFIELPKMLVDPGLRINTPLLLLSAGTAFALNIAVFLLIGKTSALTMNVAGVLKDWLLILLSVVLYRSPVTVTQLWGYGLAFVGVCVYNYRKVQAQMIEKCKASISGSEGKHLIDARR